MIKVYNSLNRKKEQFTPLEEGKVKMYACGITPYDDAHIGHAMQAVIFDTIRRYLEFKGFKVTYVRNFTDVDDKIINRANKDGVSPAQIASKYISESKRDLTELKVRPADFEPLVSDNIQNIIDFVQGLIDKGHAYVSNGSVYFDVKSFQGYGKLSGRSLEDLVHEESDSKEKKYPGDFALWKAYKEGEPFWDSPWGKGRPGWHIECSAMAKAFLGDSIDIHGGGVDIIFPHHENEVAQSEALSGRTFAKYWLHNGLVMVGKQKMSKSLGNFYTIRQALDSYGADVIRYMILSFSYNSNSNFDEKNFIDAEKRVYYYYTTLKRINETLPKCHDTGECDERFAEEMQKFDKRLTQSMDDNFNTAETLAVLNELFSMINQFLDKTTKCSKKGLKIAIETIEPIQSLFSILDEDPDTFIAGYKNRILKRVGLADDSLQKLIEERNAARKEKNFKRSDEIRDALISKGIVLKDSPDGKTDWNYNPSSM